MFIPKVIVPHIISHVVILVLFAGLYFALRGQFQMQVPRKQSATDIIYYAMSTHTLLGDNTMMPATAAAKGLTLAHVALAWSITLAISAQ